METQTGLSGLRRPVLHLHCTAWLSCLFVVFNAVFLFSFAGLPDIDGSFKVDVLAHLTTLVALNRSTSAPDAVPTTTASMEDLGSRTVRITALKDNMVIRRKHHITKWAKT